uniref:Uncharacterized protein n=1 Tax=Meloidogyne enterolobii TaxID=390850 RepID=A0A6V7UGH3_MELEN|nr:unnamed protein product [Meloidogyne enterolobii]
MFGQQIILNKLSLIISTTFMTVIIASLFCQSNAAISPLFDPISVQENNRQLVSEWEEYLKQLNKQHNNQQKFNGNGYYVLMEKPPNRIHSKTTLEKRGDEKRRDFEHGWEQCEFSPISCMLRRRRR